ncbi:MAG: hypothetical protein GX801_03795 [Fibrobacter sp.]|nr:hypothetical protein [Fibrobacter sp.]
MRVTFLTFLFFSSLAWSVPLTWENLLASALNDPSMEASEKKMQLLSTGPTPKLWSDLELRYKAEMGMMNHKFEARLKPAKIGENAALKNYWAALGNYHKAQATSTLSELIHRRYNLALRYLTQQAEIEIHEKLYQANQDRIQVLLALSGTEDFNPSDLVEAQEKDAELKAKVYESLNTLNEIALRLQVWVPESDTVILDTSWLPPVESIQQRITAAPPVVDSTYPLLSRAHTKYKANEARIDLENVGDNSVLKYVGVRYNWTVAKKKYEYIGNQLTNTLVRKDDNTRIIDRWQLSAGFTVPFFASKGDSKMRRQLDQLDRESDYLADKYSLEQEVSRLREEIGALFQQRTIQQEFTERVDAGSLFQDFAVHAGSNPLLLLKASESSLSSTLRSIRLEHEIYRRYLVLLQLTGAFSDKKVTNHLKAGLE